MILTFNFSAIYIYINNIHVHIHVCSCRNTCIYAYCNVPSIKGTSLIAIILMDDEDDDDVGTAVYNSAQ